MPSGQTVLEKMAANKTSGARKKDLHEGASCAVLFLLCIIRIQAMADFAPVIIIELFLVFGGVVAFAWWQFRDLRKEREKRMQLEDKKTGKGE
jgi:cbb3-type cytochrome oxidase subunit 3